MPEAAPETAKRVSLAQTAKKIYGPVSRIVHSQRTSKEDREDVARDVQPKIRDPDPIDGENSTENGLTECNGSDEGRDANQTTEIDLLVWRKVVFGQR